MKELNQFYLTYFRPVFTSCFPRKHLVFGYFQGRIKAEHWHELKTSFYQIIDGNGLASLFGTNLRRKYTLYSTLYNFYSVLDMINRNRFFHIFSEDFRTISNMHSLEKTLQECSLKQSSRNGIYIMCLRFQISGTYEEYFYEYS